jgi:drug/metabolite transporter (DMT)-like permease
MKELVQSETAATSSAPLSLLESRWFADLNMILVAVFWGINMPLMKSALQQMDAFLFNAMRLTLSTVVLGGIVWFQKIPVFTGGAGAPPISRQVSLLLLFSLLSGFIYQVFFLLGIKYTSAVNTALIITSIPVWIAILAVILLKEKLTVAAWTGLGIAVCGTLLVSVSKAKSNPGEAPFLGNLLVCAAALTWATSSVFSRPIMKRLSPIALAFVGVGLSVPFHWMVAWHSIGDSYAVLTDPELVGIIIYSGVFSTGLAYAMWNFGIRILGASHASAFQNLVPLIAIFSSWLLISEIPVLLQFCGGALIIGGLVVMRKK